MITLRRSTSARDFNVSESILFIDDGMLPRRCKRLRRWLLWTGTWLVVALIIDIEQEIKDKNNTMRMIFPDIIVGGYSSCKKKKTEMFSVEMKPGWKLVSYIYMRILSSTKCIFLPSVKFTNTICFSSFEIFYFIICRAQGQCHWKVNSSKQSGNALIYVMIMWGGRTNSQYRMWTCCAFFFQST